MNMNQTHAGASASDLSEHERVEVSAFVDGELDDAAVDRVIDALLASDELAGFWSDAHRAGDWMRSEDVIGVGDGEAFIRRFSSRLASEPAIIATQERSARSRSRRFWVRTGLPGASIAAALVVVGWVAMPFGADDATKDAKSGRTMSAVPTVAIVPVARIDQGAAKPAEWKTVDPDRLADYLAAHRDVTPFAYRGGSAGARPASFSTSGNAPADAPTSP
jgi:sigma-E factor negative regulatory protein RseA